MPEKRSQGYCLRGEKNAEDQFLTLNFQQFDDCLVSMAELRIKLQNSRCVKDERYFEFQKATQSPYNRQQIWKDSVR